MFFMLESAAGREYDNRRFIASMQGVDLDKMIKANADVDEKGTPTKFKEPGHYKHLPKEERKRMTQEMRKKFMGIASFTPLGGKDGR